MGAHTECIERLARVDRRVLVDAVLNVICLAQRFVTLPDEDEDRARLA